MIVAIITLLFITASTITPSLECDRLEELAEELQQSYVEGALSFEVVIRRFEELSRCDHADRRQIDDLYSEWFLVLARANRVGDMEREVAIAQMVALLDAYDARYSGEDLPGWYYKDKSFVLQLRGETMPAIAAMRAALARPLADNHRVGVQRRLSIELQRTGFIDEALEQIDEAFRLAESLDSPLTNLTTRRMRAIAWLFAGARGLVQDSSLIVAAADELGEVERAHLEYTGALSTPDELLHGTSRGAALLHLAVANQWLGRIEEAIEAARGAISVAEQTGQDHGPARILLGSTLRAAGRLQESEAVLRNMLQDGGLRPARRIWSHDQLAQTLADLGRHDEAEYHFRQAVRLQQEAVRALGSSEARAEQIAFYSRDHLRFASFLLRTGRTAEAFTQLDELRAQSLRQTRSIAQREALDPELRAEFDGLRRQRARLRGQLSATGDDAAAVLSELAHVEAELARILPWEEEADSLSVADVQQRLATDGRVLVSYFIDSPAHAFVVRADTFMAVPLDIDLSRLTHRVEDAVGFRHRSSGRLQVDGEALFDIYEAVVAPIIDLIPEGAPVTFIPDGALHEIPFGMLVTARPEPHQYHEWRYLVRRNPISVDLAAALVGVERPGVQRGDWRISAFGVGSFDRGALPTGESSQLQTLPSVRAELFSIRQLFPRGHYFTDQQATRSAFLEALARSRVLHVASHVLVNHDQPIYSTIMLGGQEQEDDAIHLYDIVDRNMVGDLVVLSACDSGRGRFRLNDGILGLQTVFRVAGASASLATMWAIDDEVAAEVIERFYHYLRAGDAKDRALQRAQLDYLDRHEGLRASPFLWAGWSISGDPSPLDASIDHRRDLWLALAGLMLLIGAHVVVRRHARPKA